MPVDLLVKNGTVVSPRASRRGHLLLHRGKVLDMLPGDDLPQARATIDATGLYVLPGLIDPHVHFRSPGLEHKEDWETGSKAAVAGGITMVIDNPNVIPPTATAQALEVKLDCARGAAYCDYAVLGVITAGNTADIVPMASGGVVGYKVFMGETVGQIPAPPDVELLEAWNVVRETGLRCAVHAEDNTIVLDLRERLQRQGRTDPLAHLESRPPAAEASAVRRAIACARAAGSKLMIYHLSSREGLEEVRIGKESGVDVRAETGPHYLLLDGLEIARLGSLMKINPPVRARDHGEALWGGLLDGTIDAVGSDHSPHTPEEKMASDPLGNIWQALSGFPGVETSVPLMLTAVNAGRLSLNQYVQLQSAGPARAWNLWPRKGNLERGADADVTIVDLSQPGVIDAARLHSRSTVTPFHGWAVTGMPVYTIVRGAVVMQHGEIRGSPRGALQPPIL
ncbi:MAG TPA: dihydroorotase family protein [bacterium]|nr:dihydroorotase family protein [bacterium]